MKKNINSCKIVKIFKFSFDSVSDSIRYNFLNTMFMN